MNIAERGQNVIMNTYGRFDIALKYGEGMYVFDENGKKYLDFVAGIAVNCLGHADKALISAIADQASKMLHVSNLYWTERQVTLAEKLVKNSCFDKVFFCNSGAEAVEACLKLSRKWGNGEKFEIIAMEQSFHGRTFGAVTATGQLKYQKAFTPLLPGISHVPFNDFDALKNAVTPQTAAILLEPLQGEGGIVPADKKYLEKVRKLCDDKDILLIFDEVQCGLGRTGYLFAYEYFGVEPDACAIAKGLGGGVPIGAALVKSRADAFVPGEHASTFGGNPLATAAANVVIDKLTSYLTENARTMGEYLSAKLTILKSKSPLVTEIRGLGLIQGIKLTVPASPIIAKTIEKGLLLVNAGADVIRFVPPLIVEKQHIDSAIQILEEVLADCADS